jgi:hypothetical protein
MNLLANSPPQGVPSFHGSALKQQLLLLPNSPPQGARPFHGRALKQLFCSSYIECILSMNVWNRLINKLIHVYCMYNVHIRVLYSRVWSVPVVCTILIVWNVKLFYSSVFLGKRCRVTGNLFVQILSFMKTDKKKFFIMCWKWEKILVNRSLKRQSHEIFDLHFFS